MAATIPDTVANFATGTIAGGAGGAGSALGPADTSVQIALDSGAQIPSRPGFTVLMGSVRGAHELARCTALNGNNTLTIQRGQEGTSAQQWSVGTQIEAVATAASFDNLWTASQQVFNVRGVTYGAVGDGATDDTTAIQNAINAAVAAGGGIVYFPIGTYLVSAPLAITADNVRLVGAGWGAKLSAAAGFLGTTLISVQAPGGAGVFRYGIAIEELDLYGADESGVGGVQLTSTYHAYMRHVRVEHCPGIGVYFTGSSSARGAYATCLDCVITNGGAGTAYETYYAENNTIIGGLVAWYNGSGGCGMKLQDGVNQVSQVVFDECDTALWLYFCNGCQISNCQFTRGVTQFISFQGATHNSVSKCYFDAFVGTASGQHMINCSSTCADNLVEGCTVNAGTGWPGFLNDNSNSGAQNRYINNQTQGLQVLLNASQSIMRNNPGYNPRGHSMTQPAVPASGTAVTNTYGVDADVYVSGGTVTGVTINSTATGLTNGAFHIPVGSSITLTYSAAPTWQWIGE